ncbi:HEAT repeat-containing protein 5A [Orchesella cincta]|uniref:HEAT repeat-containing protein 5A n=1 Tax=Orchesella cincta TaxID=48709 RepID=A0A1D2M410_ORCCI|nr:HEAT repeat-containing protein 5A [Orchesella cincta]
MSSANLLFRRSTVDCFHQLSQREAALVSKYFIKQVQLAPEEKQEEYAYYLESGKSGALFKMLDLESDQVIEIGDTMASIFSAAATQDMGQVQVCISLCKNILTYFGDDDADALKLNDELSSAGSKRAQNFSWRSRPFAVECVRKILISSPFILNSNSLLG